MMKKRLLGIMCIAVFLINMNISYVLAINTNQTLESEDYTNTKEEEKEEEENENTQEEIENQETTENNEITNKTQEEIVPEEVGENVINDTIQQEETNITEENTNSGEINTYALPPFRSSTTTPVKTIANGTYMIYSALSSSMVLDISGGSKSNDANLQIWSQARVDQQKFKLEYLNNGYYKITSAHSGKSLDVAGAGGSNGTNVAQYESNGTDAQKWIIKDEGNGYYSIISKCNNLYLDVQSGCKNDGTNVQVYEGNGSNAQKFRFVEADEFNGKQSIQDGIYMIKSALNESKLLDVSEASTRDAANIQIWSRANVSQQKFIINYTGNGLYTIENLNSKKVLDVKGGGTANATNVQQYTKNNTIAQKWVIKDCGDGYFNIISRCGGLYLDIQSGDTKNGTNVQIYEKNGSKAQKFKLENTNLGGQKTIEDGMYIISSRLDTNKVLDVDSGATYAEANIQIWDNSNVKQQKYMVEYLGNGFYTIKSVNSGKVLDVAGGGNTNGSNVWQYDANGSNAQEWIIKQSSDGFYNIISRCNELYLDIAFGCTNNGTNVQVYESNNTKAQEFQFIKAETNGIDVSKFQGDINWQQVKSSKIDFAIPRIGYRGYGSGVIVEDSKFDENIKEAIENGISCGGYFVTQAINYSEGVEEANWVINRIRGYNITSPIAIDVEWAGGGSGNNGRADNISKEQRTQAIKGFCDTIRNAGYTPMVYANKDWFMNFINTSELTNCEIWLAHYVSGAPEKKSDYTGDYKYWQYTSTGSCNGIKGNVDLNKRY